MIKPGRSLARGVFSMMILGWLAGCVGAGSNSDVTPIAPERFPEVKGISLLGDEVTLPEGFEGETNLVSMGFVRGHQEAINGWIAIVPELNERFPEMRFYEVPVIYEAGPLFRWWLNNGMRFGVVEEQARRRTITVYTDRDRFSEAIDLPGLDDIHTLLLDSDGRILWRHGGPISDEAKADLLAVLQDRSTT